MKVTFESEERKEISRLAKSLDMACLLFDLKHNTERLFKDSEVDYSPVFNRISELFEEYSINVEDLID